MISRVAFQNVRRLPSKLKLRSGHNQFWTANLGLVGAPPSEEAPRRNQDENDGEEEGYPALG